MIAKEYYKTREDGVKLFITIDALVDDNGNLLRDENNKLIPTGFLIRQNETNTPYDAAIDIENARYTYSQTDKKIEEEE